MYTDIHIKLRNYSMCVKDKDKLIYSKMLIWVFFYYLIYIVNCSLLLDWSLLHSNKTTTQHHCIIAYCKKNNRNMLHIFNMILLLVIEETDINQLLTKHTYSVIIGSKYTVYCFIWTIYIH